MIKSVHACSLVLLVSFSLPVACTYEPPIIDNAAGSGGAGMGGQNNGGTPVNTGGGEGGSGGATSSSSSSSSSSGGNSGSGGNSIIPTVHCGNVECLEGQICCSNQAYDPTVLVTECMVAFNCSAPNLIIQCDGSDDCPPGQQCCGFWGDNQYTNVMCSFTCETPHYVICDPLGVDTCPDGKICRNEILFGAGYGYCDN